MPILRTDIERALDELASQEEGMRFQGLAVVLGKMRWPELIARQRKKDFGLDAYAPASLTPERVGKGLAASITPTLKKVSADAKTAKENFHDLGMLLFVTSAKVGNADRRQWEKAIQRDRGVELHIVEREEIITLMMMPENASLCASFLHLGINAEPQLADLISKARRAATAVTQTWAAKTKGRPLIELTAVRLDTNGAESADVLSLAEVDQAVSQSRRVILEGPAGRGKTTTLIQLAQRTRAAGIPFMVELAAWTASRRGILEYIAGMLAFQAEGLTARDLARVQQAEPFLLLLNGWNEITESNSEQANHALQELERDFPSAGIIVATRAHHITPPLPGALRLRLLRLRRSQRTDYLAARLGERGTELRARIEGDASLDELTGTPFILSEVASLFEADAEIPSTKIGVLAAVLRVHEQRGEHRNALQVVPIFGRQTDYLKRLSTEMTRRRAVALPEADARAVVSAVARELADHGQIEPVGAPAVLAVLTAHHVLERVDYPQTAFQFEHQQLQEYYAALEVGERLLELRDKDRDSITRFTADYVNDVVWAEPLSMIAETFSKHTGDRELDKRNAFIGAKLVEMALAVDLVFAGELAHLCGAAVWSEVRATVGERFRKVYAIRDGSYQQYSLAAMLATGADDFSDVIVPLLSGQDEEERLRTYRLRPDVQVSSLGPNWREQARTWSDQARKNFVSELLHHRLDTEIADFAAEDKSIAVKEAAVSGLMWTGSDEALVRVLESVDAQTFERIARANADRMPAVLRGKTIAMMREFVERTAENSARLRTALDLIELGETGLDSVVKDALAALPGENLRNLESHYIEPALKYLRSTDPAWASDWVATRVAEGVFYTHEYCLAFATVIPDGLVEKCMSRLETEDCKSASVDGMIAVIAVRADARLAARVFAKLRELRRTRDTEPGQVLEQQVIDQLERLYRRLPDDVAVAGLLSCATNGDPHDIEVATGLLSRVARSDVEPLRIADGDLKARLRAYLKSSVEIVLRQDDFNGEMKSHLASSIAQVGEGEDMAVLKTLIRADIERMRRGRAARAAGDRGPLSNGAIMSYAGWHIAAVMHLDPVGAEQVLVDLLPEPEYLSDVAAAMARDFLPEHERSFGRTFSYELMWAAREGRAPPRGDQPRRSRFATALNAEIKRRQDGNQGGKPAAGQKTLAKALGAIDGRGYAATVLEVIAEPGQWDEYVRLDAAERLLAAGVVLPAATAFSLVDSMLERAKRWTSEQDRNLLLRILALCPFVDDPSAGFAKVRDVLSKWRLWGHELRELVTALGESRSDAAIDLLHELAASAQNFEQCEDNFISAVATLNTARAHELLLSFVDPNIPGIALTRRPRHKDVLVERLAELASRSQEIAARLQELCDRDLPEPHRRILASTMNSLETSEALVANLKLIDDGKPSPVPRGTWDQLESTFVERRRYGQNSIAFTEHARASDDVRARLFRMALEDCKRRKSAFKLLGRIELSRIRRGRPVGEQRHPDLGSGQSWPLVEPESLDLPKPSD